MSKPRKLSRPEIEGLAEFFGCRVATLSGKRLSEWDIYIVHKDKREKVGTVGTNNPTYLNWTKACDVPPPESGGFYAVANVGPVRPESCFCPSARMLIAAFVSLSNSQPHSHECQRSERSFLRIVPHPEHAWLV